MVRTEAQVRDFIFKYINFVNGKIKVDKVILYGSYAEGSATEDSDIDIAIESPDFGENYVEDWQQLSRWVWRSGVESILEPRPLNPSMNSFLLEEISKKGKVMFDSELESI